MQYVALPGQTDRAIGARELPALPVLRQRFCEVVRKEQPVRSYAGRPAALSPELAGRILSGQTVPLRGGPGVPGTSPPGQQLVIGAVEALGGLGRGRGGAEDGVLDDDGIRPVVADAAAAVASWRDDRGVGESAAQPGVDPAAREEDLDGKRKDEDNDDSRSHLQAVHHGGRPVGGLLGRGSVSEQQWGPARETLVTRYMLHLDGSKASVQI